MRLAGALTAAGFAIIVIGWLSAAGYYACRKFHGCEPSELFVNVSGTTALVGIALMLVAMPTILYHLLRK